MFILGVKNKPAKSFEVVKYDSRLTPATRFTGDYNDIED